MPILRPYQFFSAIILWIKKKVFAKFQQQEMFITNGAGIFWKWKLCRACAKRGQFLGIELSKIYLIGSIVPAYKNLKKSSMSLHPIEQKLGGGKVLGNVERLSLVTQPELTKFGGSRLLMVFLFLSNYFLPVGHKTFQNNKNKTFLPVRN